MASIKLRFCRVPEEAPPVVGTGASDSRVGVYDSGLAGKTFEGNSGLSYTLTLPIAATGALTLFDREAKGRLAESGKAAN